MFRLTGDFRWFPALETTWINLPMSSPADPLRKLNAGLKDISPRPLYHSQADRWSSQVFPQSGISSFASLPPGKVSFWPLCNNKQPPFLSTTSGQMGEATRSPSRSGTSNLAPLPPGRVSLWLKGTNIQPHHTPHLSATDRQSYWVSTKSGIANLVPLHFGRCHMAFRNQKPIPHIFLLQLGKCMTLL